MDTEILLANIDRLRKGMSDNAVSNAAGRPDAIRNLRRYAKGQIKGTWTLDVLDDIARALGTTPWELLRPPGATLGADAVLLDTIDERIEQRMAELERQRAPQKRKMR